MDTSWEHELKLISWYALTHTPEVYLTIAEQKCKQIKANQEEEMKFWKYEMKFKLMKKSNSKWIADTLKQDHGADFCDRVS